MKTPGPDHPIATSLNPKRVRMRYQDHVLADTAHALTLTEASLAPVQYFPRDDVERGFMSKSPHTTTCPYKGVASYYSMLMNGDLAENVAWSYEDPYPAMEQIRGLIAFDTRKVEVYEVDEADLDVRRRSQDIEQWPVVRDDSQPPG